MLRYHGRSRARWSDPSLIAQLFASGEQGFWYDPSDMATLYQDSAGTTPVTALEQPVGKILDKSGRGNHLIQPTATSRAVLSARVNLLTATETLSTQSVTTAATSYVLSFSGTGSITLSGTKTGTYSAGTTTLTGVTAGTLTLTVSGTVTLADLRDASDGFGLPAYQRVTTSTDYDSNGFPWFFKSDGVDDSYYTASTVNFSSTDKMTLWAGVRKVSDSLGMLTELSASVVGNTGAFYLVTGTDQAMVWSASSRGVAAVVADQTYGSASGIAPITSTIISTYDIAGDRTRLYKNGAVSTDSTRTGNADQGTGNYGNYTLYVGRRNNSSLPFNGRIYQLIGRGASTPDSKIAAVERYINTKTRAY